MRGCEEDGRLARLVLDVTGYREVFPPRKNYVIFEEYRMVKMPSAILDLVSPEVRDFAGVYNALDSAGLLTLRVRLRTAFGTVAVVMGWSVRAI